MASIRTISVDPALAEYIRETYAAEDEVWRRLRAETARLPMAGMEIGPDQARLLAWLVRLTGARRCLEIGTFTGASALAVARALPDDGRLICCDVSVEWTTIARKFWAEAGIAHKIELRLAPALETLAELRRSGAPRFDFAFIDADKESMSAYFEAALELLQPNGLIAVDNTLWGGAVANPERNDAGTQAIRRFNESVAQDPRVDVALLTVGDGVTLARKLP